MNLDPDKFKVDETRSNPMVVAMEYPGCPIKQICFFLVVGFGTVAEQCTYFSPNDEKTEADCIYEKTHPLKL